MDLEQDSQSSKVGAGLKLSWYLFLTIVISLVLKFAHDIFLPFTVALILYFCLSPISGIGQRIGIRRWASSFLIVLSLTAFISVGMFYLAPPLYGIFQTSGDKLNKIERKLIVLRKPMKELSNAQKEVEKITDMGKDKTVKVEVKGVSFSESIFNHIRDAIINFFTTIVILFFLLMYGDVFFRRLSLAFPYERESSHDVTTLTRIQRGTFSYLFTITVINTALGIVIGSVLYLLNFSDPLMWGILGGLLNFIPYIGCFIGCALVFLISLSTSNTIGEMILPALCYFIINSIEGQFITPVVLGNALRLNPLVILISLLYWGMIWGLAGFFVAVPILIVIQIIFTDSPQLKKWSNTLSI